MAEDNEIIFTSFGWLCPVCISSTNSQGIPFFSSRAVALHVSGKIRTGDNSHERWAVSKAGSIVHEDKVRGTINTLAEEPEPYVTEYNRVRRQQEEQRVNRLVQEQKAKEDPRVAAYQYVKNIETSLHDFVRRMLQISFGTEENGWWVQGVPLNIRKECAQRCEEDAVQEEKYKYTDLIHLKDIIDKNWKIFAPYLSQAHKSSNAKGDFLAKTAQTNEVRKRVMHPIRTEVSAEDLSFLEKFSNEIDNFIRGMY